VLAGLFAHDPAACFAAIDVPVLFVPADTGEQAWSADKQAAIDAALEVLPDGRVRWFSPADHDVHAQFPQEVAEVLIQLAVETTPEAAPDGRVQP
jgi:hypothetical protein